MEKEFNYKYWELADYVDEYEDIIRCLPATNISLAERLSLEELIWKWRNEHGYPNP